MKTLFITTPYKSKLYRDVTRKVPATLPFLGVAYVAAMLENDGSPVKILDAWGSNLSFKEIKKEIQAYQPDIIGITSTAAAFGVSVELAKQIKSGFADITIVFGGPYVSTVFNQALKEIPWIDIIVIGEGEYTMLELSKGVSLREIKGIAYRDKGEVKVNDPRPLIQDLDALPFPSRHFYAPSNYHRPFYELHGSPFASIVTSRGCPFKCRFCASHTVAGHQVRLRSIGNIVEEINMLLGVYKVKFISIADDAPVFTMDKKRLGEFCSAIEGKGFFWGAKARADSINRENLSMLAAAGCRVLEIGCESGNPDILQEWEKGVSIEQIKEAFRLMNEFGINSVAMFMLGAPNETRETIRKTIKFAKGLGATYVVARIFYPYPGTDAYKDLYSRGMLKPRDWEEIRNPQKRDPILRHPNLTTCELRLPNLTFKELLKLQRSMHVECYLNPRYLFSSINKLKNAGSLGSCLRFLTGIIRFWFRWGLQ